jgi:hypothetical protein
LLLDAIGALPGWDGRRPAAARKKVYSGAREAGGEDIAHGS